MSNRITFHTNINCGGCKANVEKALAGKNLYTSFDVDFGNPNKPATFDLTEGTQPEELQRLIREAGYKAEVVEEAGFLKRLLNRKK